jgi:hypothetical protein
MVILRTKEAIFLLPAKKLLNETYNLRITILSFVRHH